MWPVYPLPDDYPRAKSEKKALQGPIKTGYVRFGNESEKRGEEERETRTGDVKSRGT